MTEENQYPGASQPSQAHSQPEQNQGSSSFPSSPPPPPPPLGGSYPPPTGGGGQLPPPQSSSAGSVIALILGILSLMCCGLLTGIPAIFVGYSEMKAADEGRSNAASRSLAKVGFILGIIGTALNLLGIVTYMFLLFLGHSYGWMNGMNF